MAAGPGPPPALKNHAMSQASACAALEGMGAQKKGLTDAVNEEGLVPSRALVRDAAVGLRGASDLSSLVPLPPTPSQERLPYQDDAGVG
jgi:hypothetical protein